MTMHPSLEIQILLLVYHWRTPSGRNAPKNSSHHATSGLSATIVPIFHNSLQYKSTA